METPTLNGSIRRLKRRILALDSASGIVWGTFVFILVFLITVWLDLVWELSAISRVLAVSIAAAAGMLLCLRFLVFAASRTDDFRLARHLDSSGGTFGQIASGLELQTTGATMALANSFDLATLVARFGFQTDADRVADEHRTETDPPKTSSSLTLGMASLAVSDAARLADQVPIRMAAPTKSVLHAAYSMIGLLCGVGLMASVIPGLAGTEWQRFSHPFADHPPY